MSDIDDIMLVTAALALPTKWNNYKQALSTATMHYGDRNAPHLAMRKFNICQQVSEEIMETNISKREVYCVHFENMDFYNNASTLEKELLSYITEQVLIRCHVIHDRIHADMIDENPPDIS